MFILGAQKAGTSFLAFALATHPDIFFSSPKEPLFFQRANRTSEDYESYLHTYFSGARDELWVGEGSTVYLQWPRALEQLARFVPDSPKFLVCLRQPTEKAVSFFIHNWRRGRYPEGTSLLDTTGWGDALSAFSSSLYAPSIGRWFEVYPKEDFRFIDFALLQDDPGLFVRCATQFLELADVPELPEGNVNEGLPLVWDDDILRVTETPEDARGPASFSLDELEAMQRRFEDDISETESLTGLDLSDWKKRPSFM